MLNFPVVSNLIDLLFEGLVDTITSLPPVTTFCLLFRDPLDLRGILSNVKFRSSFAGGGFSDVYQSNLIKPDETVVVVRDLHTAPVTPS
jgi:hypothetical protein